MVFVEIVSAAKTRRAVVRSGQHGEKEEEAVRVGYKPRSKSSRSSAERNRRRRYRYHRIAMGRRQRQHAGTIDRNCKRTCEFSIRRRFVGIKWTLSIPVDPPPHRTDDGSLSPRSQYECLRMSVTKKEKKMKQKNNLCNHSRNRNFVIVVKERKHWGLCTIKHCNRS